MIKHGRHKKDAGKQQSAGDERPVRWTSVRGASWAFGMGALALAAAGCVGPDVREADEADDTVDTADGEENVESLRQASIFNEDGSIAEGPNGQGTPKPDSGGTYDANQPGGISVAEQQRREAAELQRLEAACGSDRNCRWDALTPAQRASLLDPVRKGTYYGLKATGYVIGGFFFGHYVAAGKWTLAALEGTSVGVKFAFDVGLVKKPRKVTVDFKGKAADLYGGDKALLRKVMTATPVIWRSGGRFFVEHGSPASVVRFKKLDGSTTEWRRLDSAGFKSGFDKGYVTWTGNLQVSGVQSIQFSNGLEGGAIRTEINPMIVQAGNRTLFITSASPDTTVCHSYIGHCEPLSRMKGWIYDRNRFTWSYISPLKNATGARSLQFFDQGRSVTILASL